MGKKFKPMPCITLAHGWDDAWALYSVAGKLLYQNNGSTSSLCEGLDALGIEYADVGHLDESHGLHEFPSRLATIYKALGIEYP